MKYSCLIVDDEKILADSTKEYFNLFGIMTEAVYGCAACREFLIQNSTDLILLDINLGDGSGFELCRELRQNTQIPILFISARTSEDDQIVALNIGGDDYIQKPYSLSVLLAKVKAVLKRYGKSDSKIWEDGYLCVDGDRKIVTVKGEPVKLKAMEFKLLTYLIENEGRVVGKGELFEKVWGDTFTGDGTLNVHIRRIRESIEKNPNEPEYIQTIWGDGYKFEGKKR